jgi:hypothetical protein
MSKSGRPIRLQSIGGTEGECVVIVDLCIDWIACLEQGTCDDNRRLFEDELRIEIHKKEAHPATYNTDG